MLMLLPELSIQSTPYKSSRRSDYFRCLMMMPCPSIGLNCFRTCAHKLFLDLSKLFWIVPKCLFGTGCLLFDPYILYNIVLDLSKDKEFYFFQIRPRECIIKTKISYFIPFFSKNFYKKMGVLLKKKESKQNSPLS